MDNVLPVLTRFPLDWEGRKWIENCLKRATSIYIVLFFLKSTDAEVKMDKHQDFLKDE